MKWIKTILSKVKGFFTSGEAEAAFNAVADLVPKAMPFLDLAFKVVTAATPTLADDAAYAAVKVMFPGLFDGTVKNGDELKLYMLGVATEMLKAKYPGVSTSIARAAVQLAYVGRKAESDGQA